MSVAVNICVHSYMHVHHKFNLRAYAALYRSQAFPVFTCARKAQARKIRKTGKAWDH